MDELDELFGADEGAEDQEVAEPEESDEEAEGEEDQEVADPEGEQSEQDNSKFAALRRKMEQQKRQAVEAARREEQENAKKRTDRLFAGAGLTDPYTKKPITSLEEYEAYQTKLHEDERTRVMQKTGMTKDEIDRFIGASPEVQAARRVTAQQEEARQAEGKRAIATEIAKIAEIDPAIKSLEDLANIPEYEDIYKKVQRGYSIYDAYRLACEDKIIDAKAAGKSAAKARNAAGKEHLSAHGQRGTGAPAISRDELEMFRAINPRATEKEIRAFYARQQKK